MNELKPITENIENNNLKPIEDPEKKEKTVSLPSLKPQGTNEEIIQNSEPENSEELETMVENQTSELSPEEAKKQVTM